MWKIGEHARRRLVSSKLVVGVLLVALLLIGFGYSIYRKNTTLNSHTVSIESKVVFAADGDSNKDGKMSGGEGLTFSFVLRNKSKAEAKFLTLLSGVDTRKLYFIRNLEGVNGSERQNNTLVFKNIVIQPRQTQTISFEASLVYDDKATELVFTPTLVESGLKQITAGNRVSARLAKTDKTMMPSMTIIKEGDN